jgi:hypothetical protein
VPEVLVGALTERLMRVAGRGILLMYRSKPPSDLYIRKAGTKRARAPRRVKRDAG